MYKTGIGFNHMISRVILLLGIRVARKHNYVGRGIKLWKAYDDWIFLNNFIDTTYRCNG